jgi:branched-chain amino acid transport system substrate-binding protein
MISPNIFLRRLKMKKLMVISLSAVTFLVMTSYAHIANSAALEPGQPIKIGFMASSSGPFNVMGKASLEGLEVLKEMMQAKRGISGHPIEFIWYDDESDASKAVMIAKRLIHDDKVYAILGPVSSGLSIAVAPVVETEQVPDMNVSSSNLIIENPFRKYVFKPIPSERILGQDFYRLFDALGAKKIAVLGELSGFGRLGTKYILDTAAQHGFTVVASESYDIGDTDFTPQLLRIKASKAEIILVYAAGPAPAIIARQIQEMRVAIPITGPWPIVTTSVVKAAGKYYEGLISPVLRGMLGQELANDDPQKKVTMSYIKAYEKKYGRNPGPFECLPHDGVMILKEALNRAVPQFNGDLKHDRNILRDEMENTKDYIGIGAIVTFSPTDHEGIKPGTAEELAILKGGKHYLWRPQERKK